MRRGVAESDSHLLLRLHAAAPFCALLQDRPFKVVDYDKTGSCVRVADEVTGELLDVKASGIEAKTLERLLGSSSEERVVHVSLEETLEQESRWRIKECCRF